MILEGVLGIFGTVLDFVLQWWWLVAPIVLFLIFKELWLDWRQDVYRKQIDSVLLHLVVPQEVLKTPLAMEQIFANLHSTYYEGTWWERNIEGRTQESFSLEIVSLAGNIYFFIRTPAKFRNLVESSIYAQYPDAEIEEVEDYIENLPKNLPSEDTDLFGSRFELINDDPYPLRTYEDFEFETKEGEGNVDPLAHLSEALGRLRNGEQIWLQIAIIPADEKWKDEGESVLEELTGRESSGGGGFSIMNALGNEVKEYARGIPQAPFSSPYGAGGEGEKKEEKQQFRFLAEHENARAKAVAEKVAKVGFKTTIHGTYIAQKDIYDKHTYFSVVSAFRQFTIQNLNGLRPSSITRAKWPFKKLKLRALKRKHYDNSRKRKPKDGFILNTAELATIFHFPGSIVTTPTLPRVKSRKGEPPASLPTL